MDIGFLRSHPILFGLQAGQLKDLGSRLTEMSFAPGDVLIGEGKQARGLFLVAEGNLTVAKQGKDIATLEAPTVIGEMELVAGNPAWATVTAASGAKAYLLSSDAFAELVDKGDPAVAKLTRNIARTLVMRLGEMNTKAATLWSSK